MTPQQKNLLDFMRGHARSDVQPSISEMCEHLGVRSRASVHRMLVALERQGMVGRTSEGERCWRALPADPFKGFKDQQLADELRRRGYKVQAYKALEPVSGGGWGDGLIRRGIEL